MGQLLEDHLREHIATSNPKAFRELGPVMTMLHCYLR